MFERFTEQAREAVVLAHEEARRSNHDYIGAEHLLLGVLREGEDCGAQVLNSLGVTLDKVYEQAAGAVGRGEEGAADRVSQASFTPRSKKALELAWREALQLGHNYIGTGHVLLGIIGVSDGFAVRTLSRLGLIRVPDGFAVQTLSRLGVDADEVRREVVKRIGGRTAERRPASQPEDSRYARVTRASLVKARVEGLLVHARCGVTDEERALPQALRVDLEYAYLAGEGDEVEETVDYGAVLQEVAGLLEREEFKLLETGMRMAGKHVLESFPEIREATVRVTKLNVPVERAVSGVSVEVTFRR